MDSDSSRRRRSLQQTAPPALLLLAGTIGAQDWRELLVPGPTPGSWSMVQHEAQNQIVLVSQASAAATTVDTWLFDGVAWTLATPATTPPARSGHCLSHDPGRNVVVLFGGGNPGFQTVQMRNDLWEWNGSNWLQRSPPVSPLPRTQMRMVYDPVRGAHLLFGGATSIAIMNNTVSDETWMWDGTRWVLLAPATRPSARAAHGLAFDRRRGRAVLFGGYYWFGPHQWQDVLGDTWEWDGTDWAQLGVPRSPQPRAYLDATYDPVRGVVMLHGGLAPGTGDAETWEWDGADWFRYQANTVPGGTGRSGMALAFLANHGVVGFGGQDSTGNLRDTWRFGGTLPAIAGYGMSCIGSAGTLELTASSVPAIGTTLGMQATGMPGNAFTMFGASTATGRTGWPGTGCEMRLQLPIVIGSSFASGGIAGHTSSIPNSLALRGVLVHFQAAAIDPAANAAGVVLSSALRAVVN
ncbi:MAG: hypothetical protein IPK26_15940 [Planctomycetes bacterium]|nr:hypothetical protein [Planctomycetota bacterium]